MLNDIRNTINLIRALSHKFYGLETFDGNEWSYIENGYDDVNPYFVCANFENGAHIPLPFFIDNIKTLKCGLIQRIAISIIRCINNSEYKSAAIECEKYAITQGYIDNTSSDDYYDYELRLHCEHYTMSSDNKVKEGDIAYCRICKCDKVIMKKICVGF